jgi:hypothetical protein
MGTDWRSLYDEAEALAASGDVDGASKAFMRAANAAAAKEARRDGALSCMRLGDMKELAGDQSAGGMWGSAAFDILTFEIDDPILIDALATRVRRLLSLSSSTSSLEALARGSTFMGAQFVNDNEQLFKLAVQIGAFRLARGESRDVVAAQRVIDDAIKLSADAGRADLEDYFRGVKLDF